MQIDPQRVREEIRLRSKLQEVVELLLDRLYLFTPCTKNRMGRAVVHTTIVNKLGLVHNNTVSRVIKAALAAKGASPSCSRGIQYYRGMHDRHG